MHISLNPPSGLDNSYFDVEFTINFDNSLKHKPTKIKLFNEIQQLNILATNNCVIRNNEIVCDKTPSILSGYINLFNDDKMNQKLSTYVKMAIKCTVDDLTTKETFTSDTVFYNESFSVDQQILPFSLKVPEETDFTEDILITITTDKEMKLHLQLESAHKEFDFHVVTKNGTTDIKIPREMIFHEIITDESEKISFNYLKESGITPFNTVNRKKIKIPNCTTKVVSTNLVLNPQTRKGPLGNDLDETEFILSDRYFVPVIKDYTNLKTPVKNIKTIYGNIFKNEILETQNTDLMPEPTKNNTKPIIKSEDSFFKHVFNTYNSKSRQVSPQQALKLDKPDTHTGDCGCKRKKTQLS